MANMGKRLLCLLLLIILLSGCIPSGSVNLEEKNVEYLLSNPNADKTATQVYDYLCSLAGAHTLSAQQESTWMGSPDYEMDYLLEKTGRLPAIRGLDYMHDDFEGVNRRALEWWHSGGLVTICWHTGADFRGEWKDCMETAIPDWEAVLTPGTAEHEALLAGMDKAGHALLELQEQGVAVLWRPFHEFDGKWFWWGKGGPENFRRLWQLMYRHFTQELGLNNLIWVLGYSHLYRDYEGWYPGDEYVDIIGADSYQGGVENRLYRALTDITRSKPYAFHECGTNPTAQELSTTPWIWFMTWHTNYVTDENTPEALRSLYQSEYVITRDELPAFR